MPLSHYSFKLPAYRIHVHTFDQEVIQNKEGGKRQNNNVLSSFSGSCRHSGPLKNVKGDPAKIYNVYSNESTISPIKKSESRNYHLKNVLK